MIGAAEGWMVADKIAQRKIPVVVKPLTNIPTFDALNATLENAARLQAAGVEVVLLTKRRARRRFVFTRRFEVALR